MRIFSCVLVSCVMAEPMLAAADQIYLANPGARQTAMAGAFVAQADDSYALFYNPAGMALVTNAGDEADKQLAFSNGRLQSDTDATLTRESLYSFTFTSVSSQSDGSSTALGMGWAQVARTPLLLPDNQGPTVKPLVSNEIILGCAGGPSWLKIGGGLNIVHGKARLIDGRNGENDVLGLGGNLGLLVLPLDAYVDVLNTSWHSVIRLGAMYQTEAADDLKYREPKALPIEREVSLRPENAVAGAHVALGVLAGGMALELRGNVSVSQQTWSNLMPLLEPNMISQEVNLELQTLRMGGELLLMPFDSDLTIALRAGASSAEDNQDNRYANDTRSFGFGLDYSGYQLNLATEDVTPVLAANGSTKQQNYALTLGVVF